MNLNQIQNIITESKNESSLTNLIVDYSSLRQQLDNSKNQSWYFKKGIPAKQEKLVSIEKNFEEIRQFFNTSAVDDLLNIINKKKKWTAHLTEDGRNVVTDMCRNIVEGETEFLTELIRLKSKMNKMESIDFYTSHPDEFLKFME